MLETLEGSAEFVKGLTLSGGFVELIIHLPGNINIGDNMDTDFMSRLAALHVKLGIEVFPDFG